MNNNVPSAESLPAKNPLLGQALGLCAAMTATTSVVGGVSMGLAVALTLTLSNIVVSALRKFIPHQIRLVVFAVIIAGFAAAADMLLRAFWPAAAGTLSTLFPLTAVNCLVLGRAEAFASRNDVAASALDGVLHGAGYTLALLLMSLFREVLGAGTIGAGLLGKAGEGIRVLPAAFTVNAMLLPVGGFLVLAVLIAAARWIFPGIAGQKEG